MDIALYISTNVYQLGIRQSPVLGSRESSERSQFTRNGLNAACDCAGDGEESEGGFLYFDQDFVLSIGWDGTEVWMLPMIIPTGTT